MKTTLLLIIIFLFAFALHTFSKKEGFLVPLVYSEKKTDFFEPLLLEDEYSPYIRFNLPGPMLSGENNSTVAAQYAPFHNNSDVAKTARGWTLPTEGNCIPNELCGRFYLRRKVNAIDGL